MPVHCGDVAIEITAGDARGLTLRPTPGGRRRTRKERFVTSRCSALLRDLDVANHSFRIQHGTWLLALVTGFFLTDLLLPNILLCPTEFLRRRFLRNVRRSKKMFQLFRVRIVCYVRYVLLLSYTTIDTSHNAFLCLCTIEITKIILPISINFN